MGRAGKGGCEDGRDREKMKKVLIIGAGPAGLTAAYELLTRSTGYEVIIFEETEDIGGISKTVEHNGDRMDMGGHRFFSKVPEVEAWWQEMLPVQGKPAKDDLLLGRESMLCKGGPDPETTDKVMLKRHRLSRIYFMDKFFDYPISLKLETFKNMGAINTIAVGVSYLASVLHKRKEDNLEVFYINRFGKRLYSMFFEYYTENLWGRHPSGIDASWGGQRVKGLSISAILKDIWEKMIKKKSRQVETSLIEAFYYPKLGPGQLWETVAEKIRAAGGVILHRAKVVRLKKDQKGDITALVYRMDGEEHEMEGDIVISSMPLKDLVAGMEDVPDEPKRIAQGLPYRDYMTLGVSVPRLRLENKTDIRTINGIIPDQWIYVQDRRVKMGRIQIYNNWSPYLVADLEHRVWLGLEYFVTEGDRYWTMPDEEFEAFAIEEMIKIGLIDSREEVLDTHLERVKKAYPAYFDTYSEIDVLIDYLDTIENLYCVGRNGQHRYNNMDHSMCTSFEAVENILSGRKDKTNLWKVNTETGYHEDYTDRHANDFREKRRV